MKKVFLGGTCNNSNWRKFLIPNLRLDYFNPVVDNWNEEAQEREKEERKNCDFCLYVITPKMSGVYSIAELIDDSNKRPEKTVFCFLEQDVFDKFDVNQLKSLAAVGVMVVNNGGIWCEDLDHVADYLNGRV